MNKEIIFTAEDDCERPKGQLRTILLSSICPTAGVVSTIAAFILEVKRRKKIIEQRLWEDNIQLLQDDDVGMKYLFFLAFSSEDTAFVKPNVLQPLEVGFLYEK